VAAGGSKAVWAVVLGVLSVATMPVAVGLTRFSSSYELLHAGFAILRARRSRARDDATLGRAGGRRAARIGRLLGILGICIASSSLIAVAVYGVLVYLGG
jgi:hypothetical protein